MQLLYGGYGRDANEIFIKRDSAESGSDPGTSENPDILILDEPLSGQDVQSQEMFVKLMKELNQGRMTLVMACHEKYLVEQLAQEVYQIDQGCIKMQGGDITVENHD